VLYENLNKDYKVRDRMIFNDEIRWRKGAIRRFDDLNLDMLRKLIKHNFISLEDKQNDAPTVFEFYNFITIYPQFLLGGYATDPYREDYRVSIDTISLKTTIKINSKLVREFERFFHLNRNESPDYFISEEKLLYSFWD